MAATRFTRRLQKVILATATTHTRQELSDLQKNPPPGLVLDEVQNLQRWTVNIVGAEKTIFEGEQFKLQFTFPNQYPLEAPEVIFVGSNIPEHPHIYSNGHICLSILYDQPCPVCEQCVFVHSLYAQQLHRQRKTSR